jgi:xanthine dehydrogenase accessory factor
MIPGLILLRGGGDLASGIALRLHHAGLKVVISELPQPLAVRRTVSFSEAVYWNVHRVEDVTARLVRPDGIEAALQAGEIPVLVDPEAGILRMDEFRWSAVVDARMLKRPPASLPAKVPLHIGVGPGFHAGRNCDAVVETRRSHTLGRVFWEGLPQADSGLPEGDPRRVLRAPVAGVLRTRARIGEHVEPGQVIAEIQSEENDDELVSSPLGGVLRGLIHDGVRVEKEMKIGDVDARNDVKACFLVSDKALAVGGGVLEAILAFRRETQNY